jgi:hypothetical protein
MSRLAAIACIAILTSSSAAAEAPRWGVTLTGGISAFFNSQSFALGHLTKPVIKLQTEYDYSRRIRLGVELSGVAAADNGYRLIGGYATVAGALYAGDVYRLELVAGVGGGTAPPILSSDLAVEHSATAWFQFGLRHRWTLPGGRIVLGIDLVDEHLSTVSLTGAVGLRF